MASSSKDKDGFTLLQKRFAEEFLVDRNCTAAARRAGSPASGKNLRRVGSQLYRTPHVRAWIDAELKKLGEKTKITAERVLLEYGKIAFANILDFVELDEHGEPIMKNGKFVLDFKKVTPEQAAAIGKIKDDGTIELLDKKGALDSLGRHLGMFKDRIDLGGSAEIKTELRIKLV